MSTYNDEISAGLNVLWDRDIPAREISRRYIILVGSIFLHHVSLLYIKERQYGVLIVNAPGIGSIWNGRPIESLISSNNVSIADSTNVPIISIILTIK